MWRTAENIWTVLVCRPIGTPDGLILRVSSGVPGAEFTLRMQQVYSIHVVLLRRLLGATRMLRPGMGGRGKQEPEGATLASGHNHCCARREPFFAHDDIKVCMQFSEVRLISASTHLSLVTK